MKFSTVLTIAIVSTLVIGTSSALAQYKKTSAPLTEKERNLYLTAYQRQSLKADQNAKNRRDFKLLPCVFRSQVSELNVQRPVCK